MPTTLLDSNNTIKEIGRAQIVRPFQNYPTPDIYARTIRRKYECPVEDHTPATANRTSYTNLLTYSEDFSNAAWTTKTLATVSQLTAEGPSSSTTVSRIQGSAGAWGVERAPTVVSGATYTFSVWLKSNTASAQAVRLRTINGSGSSDIQVGTAWQRVSITGTASSTTGSVGIVRSSTDSSADILVWGAQLELASTPGPYIPTTDSARTISAPDLDTSTDTIVPADPFAYLVEESDPVPNSNLTLCQFSKTFARIPADQVRYASRVFTKPVVPNRSTGTPTVYVQETTADQPSSIGAGAYYDDHLHAPNNKFYGPFTAATYTQPVVATGGTFTVTYKTSTTGALAYNASSATIAAAINALADVSSDGLTVSVNVAGFSTQTSFTITISAGSTSSRFTANAASLTGVTLTKSFTEIFSSTSQQIRLAGKFTATGHGLDPAQSLVCAATTIATASTSVYILQPVTSWSSVDANTIAVISSVGTFSAVSYGLLAQYLRDYTPGSTQVSSRITEKYYLPGVTSGISTVADIPIESPNISDDDILAAVLGTTGFQPVDFEGPSQWLGSIHRTVTTEVDLDDI